MSAPAFGSIGTLFNSTTSTPAFAVPASVASGDIIVIAFFADVAATTISAFPSGFAEAQNSPRSVAGNYNLHVCWKRATGNDTGTYSFTLSGSVLVQGNAVRYTGCVAAGNPWDSPTNAVDGGSGLTLNTPDANVTTAGPDRMLFFAGTNGNGDGGTWTAPSGFNQRQGGSSVTTCEISDKVQAVAGASGNTHATSDITGQCGSWLGALIGTTPSTIEYGAYIATNRHPGRGPGFPMYAAFIASTGGITAVDQTINVNAISSSEISGNTLIAPAIAANGITTSEVSGLSLVAPSITTGITSSEKLGSPAVTATYTINANGIVGSENFGAPAVGQSVTPQAIPSAESVGSPAVTATYTIQANGIPSSEVSGNTLIASGIPANSITTSERFGNTLTAFGIPANAISSSEQLGNAQITSTYTINANGIPSSEVSGNAFIATASSVTPQGISGAEQLGQPAVTATYTINAQGISSSEVSGNTAVTQIISDNSITSSERLGNPSLQVITAANAFGIPTSETFGNATITATYTIQANGISSSERSGNANASAAAVIAAGAITSSEVFGKSAITTGSVTVNAQGITSSEQSGRSIVSLGILASTIQAYGITSENKIGYPFTGPEADDVIIWKAERNVIYVADEALASTNAIDDITYVPDDVVLANAGPDEA